MADGGIGEVALTDALLGGGMAAGEGAMIGPGLASVADLGAGAGAGLLGSGADVVGSDWASGLPSAMNPGLASPSMLSQLGSALGKAQKGYGAISAGANMLGLNGQQQHPQVAPMQRPQQAPLASAASILSQAGIAPIPMIPGGSAAAVSRRTGGPSVMNSGAGMDPQLFALLMRQMGGY